MHGWHVNIEKEWTSKKPHRKARYPSTRTTNVYRRRRKNTYKHHIFMLTVLSLA